MITYQCPYCDKKLSEINPAHLKRHGKTRQEAMTENPDMPRRAFGHINCKPTQTEAEKVSSSYYQDKATDKMKYDRGGHSKWVNNKGLISDGGRKRGDSYGAVGRGI